MRFGLIIGLYGMFQYGTVAAQDNSAVRVENASSYEKKLYCEQPAGFDVSLGSPTRGRLKQGVPVYSTQCLDSRSSNRYGTQDLSDLLNNVACHMYELTGARLSVDDLSQYGGGKFRPHKSHQNGLDVDVGHYYAGERIIGNNTGLISGNSETMAVTWEFVRALGDHRVQVQYIFWSPRNIANLKRYVVRSFGDGEWEKYGSVFHPEKRHKRHMHIRIDKPMNGMRVAGRVNGVANKQITD